HLEGAFIGDAHLEGKRIDVKRAMGAGAAQGAPSETLPSASLREAFFDNATKLVRTTLGNEEFGIASVLDAHWNGANLAQVKWIPQGRNSLQGLVLDDERAAWRATDLKGKPKSAEQRLGQFEEAVRANRQIAAALRDNGLTEYGDHFAYRAQA